MTELVLRLPPEPVSVTEARRAAAATVASWSEQAGRPLSEDPLVLLVSEVVTNVVLHARTPLTLVLRRSGDVAVVEVTDLCDRLPVRRHYASDAVTGRGLQLLDELAGGWGTRPGPGPGPGKVVFFAASLVPAGGLPEQRSGGAPDLSWLEQVDPL